MRYLLITLLLSGCFATVPDAVAPPPEKVVHIDPRVLEPCEPLLKLPDQSTSFEDVISITLANYEIYSNCATKQKNSSILLREFSNTKEIK